MTFDEARLMANVNARAERLFEDGYRARWQGTHTLLMRSAAGAMYRINTLTGECSCPFFQGHVGRHPCKHVLGYPRLLERQRINRRMIGLLLLLCWIDLDDGDPRADEGAFPKETEAVHACL